MKFDSDRAHYYGQRGGLACLQRHGRKHYQRISQLGNSAKRIKQAAWLEDYDANYGMLYPND